MVTHLARSTLTLRLGARPTVSILPSVSIAGKTATVGDPQGLRSSPVRAPEMGHTQPESDATSRVTDYPQVFLDDPALYCVAVQPRLRQPSEQCTPRAAPDRRMPGALSRTTKTIKVQCKLTTPHNYNTRKDIRRFFLYTVYTCTHPHHKTARRGPTPSAACNKAGPNFPAKPPVTCCKCCLSLPSDAACC